MHDGRLSSLGLPIQKELRSFVPSPSPEHLSWCPDSVLLLITPQLVMEPIDSLRKPNLTKSGAAERDPFEAGNHFIKARNPDKATFYPIPLEPPGS